MGWTLKLGKIAGIKIQVHATFLILVAWVAWVYWRLEPTVASVRDGLIFLFIVFGIVVLHELSHAFAARFFGIGTADITLLPVGGVSRLERQPERPHQELVVSLAGPLSNFVLASVCLAVLLVRSGDVPAATQILFGQSRSLVADLFWVNMALGIFNLLPAFPMDGGRAVRALLAMVTDRARATRIAAGLGKAMAVVFLALGLFYNPVLALIGVFVWFGATAEGVAADMAQAMRGLTVADAMVTGVQTVRPEDPLARPVQLMLSGFQQDFPVVDASNHVVGMLPLEALLRGMVERGQGATVGSAMVAVSDVPRVHPEDDLFEVAAQLSRRDRRTLPVVRDGTVLLGVLTMENVSELLRVHQALGARPGVLRVAAPAGAPGGGARGRDPEPRALSGGPRHG